MKQREQLLSCQSPSVILFYHLCNCNRRAHADTRTHLAVMDVVSSGPSMFARLFTVLPLEEIVHHGIILGASSSSHTLRTRHKWTRKHEHYPVNRAYFYFYYLVLSVCGVLYWINACNFLLLFIFVVQLNTKEILNLETIWRKYVCRTSDLFPPICFYICVY